MRMTVPRKALVSLRRGTLSIELLFGNDAILGELLKPLKVQTGVFQRGLVFEEGRLCLTQLHFIGARINLRQQLAFLDLLPFFEVDVYELAVNTALYRDSVVGLH